MCFDPNMLRAINFCTPPIFNNFRCRWLTIPACFHVLITSHSWTYTYQSTWRCTPQGVLRTWPTALHLHTTSLAHGQVNRLETKSCTEYQFTCTQVLHTRIMIKVTWNAWKSVFNMDVVMGYISQGFNADLFYGACMCIYCRLLGMAVLISWAILVVITNIIVITVASTNLPMLPFN